VVWTDVARITNAVAIGIRLLRIVNCRAIVKIAGVGRESGIAVTIAIGIGTDIAAIADTITIEIFLVGIVNAGAIVI